MPLDNEIQPTGDEAMFSGPRPARPEDLPAVIELLDLVFRVSRGNPPSVGGDWAHVYCAANAPNVLIVTAGAKVVASTGIWISDVELGPVRLRVGGINCVATLPEFRKHGLGMSVMKACHKRMLAQRCQVGLLNTGIANWYRRLGWELAGSSRTYRVNRGNVGLLPDLPAEAAVEDGRNALEEILALHHARKWGAVRTAESFTMRLKARKVADVLLVRQGGRALAYLLAYGPHIVEWAGPAQIVAGLVKAWFRRLDNPSASTSGRKSEKDPVPLTSVMLLTPAGGDPLVEMLEKLRITSDLNYTDMIRLLDPQGVLQAYGHGDISLSEYADTFTLRRADQTATLDRLTLTKLFFGPERVSDFAADVFPLPFWQWPLERV
jgi:ribosomal protein S18 acetylase RimI-like enzyme